MEMKSFVERLVYTLDHLLQENSAEILEQLHQTNSDWLALVYHLIPTEINF